MGEKMRLSGLWVFFFFIKLKIEGEEFQGTLDFCIRILAAEYIEICIISANTSWVLFWVFLSSRIRFPIDSRSTVYVSNGGLLFSKYLILHNKMEIYGNHIILKYRKHFCPPSFVLESDPVHCYNFFKIYHTRGNSPCTT